MNTKPSMLIVPSECCIRALAIIGDPDANDLIGWLRAMGRIGVRGIECSN